VRCKRCGAELDVTMTACPACGADVELGRLTGILGLVCRACDAYNDPGARTCVACGKPIGAATQAPAEASAAAPPASDPAPPAGSPVVRSFPKPSAGAPTRFIPTPLRPSPAASSPPAVRGEAPSAAARDPSAAQGPGAPVLATCPRCGEKAQGRFCAQCGQALFAAGSLPTAPIRAVTHASRATAPGRARLVLEGGGSAGATYPLDAETVEAGRAKGAIRFPDDPCLAPHHATFHYRAGTLHVRDEGAPGGVFLRLRGLSVPLRPGDQFAVGERLLRFAGPLSSAPAPPPDGTRRLGAPRPAPPSVVVEEWLEGGACGRVFVRSGPAVTIGRAGCAVSLGDDPHVSDAHAELLLDGDGQARLRDLGSTTGTFLRIPPGGERELHDGDAVRIGREVLRVQMT
jgi:pSer/pThr/pTyr-binding forkhead associated (FHA) protein